MLNVSESRSVEEGNWGKKFCLVWETLAYWISYHLKGKLEPQDPPSLWPEHRDILPPSLPPKLRPTKRFFLSSRIAARWDLIVLGFHRVNIDISERVCSNLSYSAALLLLQSKARSQGIPRFMVEIEQDLKFTTFHIGISVQLTNYIYGIYIYIYGCRIYHVVDPVHETTFLTDILPCSLSVSQGPITYTTKQIFSHFCWTFVSSCDCPFRIPLLWIRTSAKPQNNHTF